MCLVHPWIFFIDDLVTTYIAMNNEIPEKGFRGQLYEIWVMVEYIVS
jgi:hypothetical protein